MDAVTCTCRSQSTSRSGSTRQEARNGRPSKGKIKELSGERAELTMTIGGRERTGTGEPPSMSSRRTTSGTCSGPCGTRRPRTTSRTLIDAAHAAAPLWRALTFDDRAAILLKAADLLSGPWRATINAATILGQSKSVYQSEIDAACELIDFWRYNVHFARRLLEEQPQSGPGTWNRMEYRPLEGFVLAITPFNFTAIGGNLPSAPALLGNVVVWKPSPTQQLGAHFTLRLLEAAGLPPGVINLVTGDGQAVSRVALPHRDLAGIHFTGSTPTFQHLWRAVGENIGGYRGYPRVVGETGGKDFVIAHPSADPAVLTTALVRGAYEYQGQKCSAASRAYLPRSLWDGMRDDFLAQVESLTMGDASADPSLFMGAVIDGRAFAKHTAALRAGQEPGGRPGAHRRRHRRLRGLLRPAHGARVHRPHRRGVHHRVLRPDPRRARLRRRALLRCARPGRRRGPVRAERLGHRPGLGGHRGGDGGHAVRRGQLLRQRQADRRGGRSAAVRRGPRQWDQRQG